MLRLNQPSCGPLALLGLSALGLLTASCSSHTAAPPVDVSVAWLTERGTIPDDVTGVQFVVIARGQGEDCRNTPDAAVDPTCSPISSPPAPDRTEVPNSLVRDLDGDERAELLADALPVGQPISIELRAYDNADRTHVGYVGRVGPLVLAPGERRHVALRMYAAGAATVVDTGDMNGRFLQTATALSDGRVLVAGGFTQGARQDCPAALAADSRCFDLVATDEAWLFEPATARFFPVTGGMLAARGGHTATRLPDGRVLIAGGASHATLELAVVGSVEPRFVMDDTDASPASFELFDPGLNPEASDVDGDGDPGRGGFAGSANDPTTPGMLDQKRLMHAAAALPGQGTRVLLAGGSDAEGSATWEIFDIAKPGGYGVYFNAGNTLPTPRTLPSALTGPNGVWIVGGAEVSLNADLADVWNAEMGNPNGRVRSAREFTGARYPNPVGASDPARPQYGLLRPTLAPLDGGGSMVVVGWLGPRCVPGSTSPDYSPAATERCPPNGGPARNHTVVLGGDTAGATVATTGVPAMSFASSATLDDGSVFIAGGISQILWHPVTANAVLFEATTVPTTGSAVRSTEGPSQSTGRVFAASAAIAGRGVLTLGGITSSTWDALTFVPSAEVWIRAR